MRQINDRKAPRLGKAEFSTSIVTTELYEEWVKSNPDYKLTYKQFIKIWDDISDNIREEIVVNPMGIKFSHSNGEVRVQFLPKSIKGEDHAISNSEGEDLPFLNIITKGKVAKISWIRKNAIKFNPNILLFAFQQSRLIGQGLSKVLWDKPEIYRRTHTETYKKNTNVN